jgi:hypothetical protein
MNPAPKGDPTGKYTLNGWGQTEADFAFFDLAQDKVELKSDGWRTEKIADDPNVYEWWYFDIHNHDALAPSRSVSAATADADQGVSVLLSAWLTASLDFDG